MTSNGDQLSRYPAARTRRVTTPRRVVALWRLTQGHQSSLSGVAIRRRYPAARTRRVAAARTA